MNVSIVGSAIVPFGKSDLPLVEWAGYRWIIRGRDEPLAVRVFLAPVMYVQVCVRAAVMRMAVHVKSPCTQRLVYRLDPEHD